MHPVHLQELVIWSLVVICSLSLRLLLESEYIVFYWLGCRAVVILMDSINNCQRCKLISGDCSSDMAYLMTYILMVALECYILKKIMMCTATQQGVRWHEWHVLSMDVWQNSFLFFFCSKKKSNIYTKAIQLIQPHPHYVVCSGVSNVHVLSVNHEIYIVDENAQHYGPVEMPCSYILYNQWYWYCTCKSSQQN